MKTGSLVRRNMNYESYGLDPGDPRDFGVPDYTDAEDFVGWERDDVGIVLEKFETFDGTAWVRILVPGGAGYCHLDEVDEVR